MSSSERLQKAVTEIKEYLSSPQSEEDLDVLLEKVDIDTFERDEQLVLLGEMR